MRVSHFLLVFTILIIYVYSIPVQKTQEKSDSPNFISSLIERYRRSTIVDAPMKWRWFLFIFLYGLLIMLSVIACFLWKYYKSKRRSAPPNRRTEASDATSGGQEPTPDQMSLISNDSSILEEHLNNELDQKDCPENLKELPIHERIYYLSYNSKYEIDEKNLKKNNIFLGKECTSYFDREKVQMFYEELKIMCKIGRHPNVLALVGATTTKMGAKRTLIITELIEGKDLLEFLRKKKEEEKYVDKFVNSETGDSGYLLPNSSKRKKESNILDDNLDVISTFDLLSFAYQIANGMEYLAKVPLVHRDLALRNVLIKNNKIIRISDFGLSKRHLDNKEYYKPRDIGSTELPICHVSPESFKSNKFTQKSDVWSFGVCLFEIFSLGKKPYEGQNKSTLIEYLDEGNRLKIPDNCHPDVANIMKLCWHSNPDIRPDFAMCKEYFESHLEKSARMLLTEIKQKLQNEAVEQEKLEDWIKKDGTLHNNSN
ncbi:hypothetical protein GCK72_005184 [Caenorhabditis remanei]|uniref:receptor protein-tyrosine kinase n=1 Tax=Caenorhabditis remanei TaxID=31234 RepID=A0A6A5HGI8_CAERE|nr:hypothetical protein GCK72_005184 [Caenorhabditis remanei]KAF1765232.1 hypothetical protein GCK72_005184 [Caenorhabditis remanei]